MGVREMSQARHGRRVGVLRGLLAASDCGQPGIILFPDDQARDKYLAWANTFLSGTGRELEAVQLEGHKFPGVRVCKGGKP